MEKLANSDAFRSMNLDRYRALLEVSALHDRPTQLMQSQQSESLHEPEVTLPELRLSEHVVQERPDFRI